MQYRFVSVLAAGVLVAVSNAAPVPSAEAQTLSPTNPDDIQLGKPSSEIIWSKRDDEPTNPDDVQLGPPTSEIIWSKDKKRAVTWSEPRDKKRDVTWSEPKDTFTISKPKTVVTWSTAKRDTVTQPDTIDLGKPSSEVSWGKRDGTDPADTIELGKPSTIITWGKEKRQTLGNPDSETTWGKRGAEKPKDSFKLGKATTVVTWS
ncbi:hypothetical protein J4E80_008695 [Alternaria sp. BMP 0032]|nr:hypothetical protein J4E80_008695 [Alternaria sp. BMP 0032]